MKELDRSLEIDNVDAVTGAENVGFHLGIPAACLMAEMDSRFQQLFHCNNCHFLLLLVVFLHPSAIRACPSPDTKRQKGCAVFW
jgi:hypothetical protein